MRHLVGIDDLSDREVADLVARARDLADGVSPAARRQFVLGTAFLTPSMRTRVGFSVAAMRLGGGVIGVDELRIDPAMSAAEPQDDALRVLSGMVDVLVTRTSNRVELSSLCCPLVNGGNDTEHPSQALIDVAAMQRFKGAPDTLRVGLCGDLMMRSAVSLLRLFTRMPPRLLTLMAPPDRIGTLPPGLAFSLADPDDLADLDVLLMVGLPPGRGESYLDEVQRRPWALTADRIDRLPSDAIVLSPMPVIDELDPAARRDHRLRMFEQSDHAVFVRMAIVELMLGS